MEGHTGVCALGSSVGIQMLLSCAVIPGDIKSLSAPSTWGLLQPEFYKAGQTPFAS